MFSRAFRISFKAESAAFQQWLKASPGIQDASITIDDGKIRKYEIKLGEELSSSFATSSKKNINDEKA